MVPVPRRLPAFWTAVKSIFTSRRSGVRKSVEAPPGSTPAQPVSMHSAAPVLQRVPNDERCAVLRQQVCAESVPCICTDLRHAFAREKPLGGITNQADQCNRR